MDKGFPFEAPQWWTDIVRPKLREHRGLQKLSADLAKIAGRAEAWHHSRLIAFRDGGTCTQELAEALSVHFGIPRPFFIAQTRDEADAMQAIQKVRKPTEKEDRLRIGRLSQRDSDIAEMEGEVARQSAALGSSDEAPRRPSRRRSRSVE